LLTFSTAYYANHNIGWVARPAHGALPEGHTTSPDITATEKASKKSKKEEAGDKFMRAGRFKKASNMNYGLALSLKAEAHLERLQAEQAANNQHGVRARPSFADSTSHFQGGMYGLQYASNRRGPNGSVHDFPPQAAAADATAGGNGAVSEMDLEERALQLAIEETYEESGRRWKPWAANGRASRLGEILLIVDSDTIVPEVSLVLILFVRRADRKNRTA
jgi:hypothetical protein